MRVITPHRVVLEGASGVFRTYANSGFILLYRAEFKKEATKTLTMSISAASHDYNTVHTGGDGLFTLGENVQPASTVAAGSDPPRSAVPSVSRLVGVRGLAGASPPPRRSTAVGRRRETGRYTTVLLSCVAALLSAEVAEAATDAGPPQRDSESFGDVKPPKPLDAFFAEVDTRGRSYWEIKREFSSFCEKNPDAQDCNYPSLGLTRECTECSKTVQSEGAGSLVTIRSGELSCTRSVNDQADEEFMDMLYGIVQDEELTKDEFESWCRRAVWKGGPSDKDPGGSTRRLSSYAPVYDGKRDACSDPQYTWHFVLQPNDDPSAGEYFKAHVGRYDDVFVKNEWNAEIIACDGSSSNSVSRDNRPWFVENNIWGGGSFEVYPTACNGPARVHTGGGAVIATGTLFVQHLSEASREDNTPQCAKTQIGSRWMINQVPGCSSWFKTNTHVTSSDDKFLCNAWDL